MGSLERKRAFIVRFVYAALCLGLVYAVLKYALPLFMPFLLAFLIAFILKPLIRRIADKTPLSRSLTAVLLLILFYAIVGTLLVLLSVRIIVTVGGWFGDLPRLYRESIEPVITSIGASLDHLFVGMDPALAAFFDTASQSISNAVSTVISAISSGALNMATRVAGQVPWVLAATLITIISSFFFVVDYQRISTFIVRQMSPHIRRLVFVIKDYVVNVLFRFARAYLILITLTFVEVSIGLLILRVENAFLIAFITAIVDILPVLGTGTIMIPWALYALFSGNYFLGIGLAVLYVTITVIRQFLEPRVVGRQIGLYPLLTLISMFIGLQLFGFWGMFGLPVALTVIIHLNRTGEIHWFAEEPAVPQEGKAVDE